MEGSMSGMGGPAPLNASGVDFSNATQAMDFLDAMLDDSVFQVDGNTYARYFWYGVVVFIALAAISDVIWRATLMMRYVLDIPKTAEPTVLT
jgi:ferric-chelate reductase